MAKRRIVWIDDDINTPILRPYVDEFEENNFEIIKVSGIENLISDLKKEAEKTLSAILIDIIMPPQHLDFRKTRGGLTTGVVIIEDILEDVSFKNIPIIVVTNVDDVAINDYCKEKDICCIEKKDYFSDSFVSKIDEIINNSMKKTSKDNV